MPNTNRHEVDLIEKPFDRWMLGLRTGATIVTAIAVMIGVWFGFRELSSLTNQLELQTTQLTLQRQSLEDEWRQKFFDNQIQIYGEVAAVAGKLAALGDNADEVHRGTLEREFMSLYWGKMCIVEGTDVENAMMLFKRGLEEKISTAQLEQLALNLVHVCRNETNERYFTVEDREKRESRFGDNNEILKKMQRLANGSE